MESLQHLATKAARRSPRLPQSGGHEGWGWGKQKLRKIAKDFNCFIASNARIFPDRTELTVVFVWRFSSDFPFFSFCESNKFSFSLFLFRFLLPVPLLAACLPGIGAQVHLNGFY